MARRRQTRTQRTIRRYLDDSGVPYTLAYKKNHIQIVICGSPVAVFSYGGNSGGNRGFKNLFAAIDREAKEFHGQETRRPNPID